MRRVFIGFAMKNKQSTKETTLKGYARHDEGDSRYLHATGRVKTDVFGVAVFLTLGFAFVELIGGLWGNSLALVSDAWHMITDSLSLFLALLANWIATKGADSDHSFGHARVEALAAFINALAMLGVVVWIFVQAAIRLTDPPQVQGGVVMGIASVGLLMNLAVIGSLSRDKKNMNTRAALLHVAGDLMGSVAAIVSGGLVYFAGPRFSVADPILSVFVGLLLLRATYSIFKESVPVLLDAVPEGVDYNAVGDALAQIPGVKEVHDLHVWMMAPGHSAISAHLHTDAEENWDAMLALARRTLSERFGIDHITLQPERRQKRSPNR